MRLSVPVSMALIQRTEEKQARAIAGLRRLAAARQGESREAALLRWWLDLLDDRHAELRVALNVNGGRTAPVLRFAGGPRRPYPDADTAGFGSRTLEVEGAAAGARLDRALVRAA